MLLRSQNAARTPRGVAEKKRPITLKLLDEKIDRVETRLDAKIDEAVHTLRSDIRHSAAELRTEMDARFDAVDARFGVHDERFTGLFAELKSIKEAILTLAAENRELHGNAALDRQRLGSLETRVDVLEAKVG